MHVSQHRWRLVVTHAMTSLDTALQAAARPMISCQTVRCPVDRKPTEQERQGPARLVAWLPALGDGGGGEGGVSSDADVHQREAQLRSHQCETLLKSDQCDTLLESHQRHRLLKSHQGQAQARKYQCEAQPRGDQYEAQLGSRGGTLAGLDRWRSALTGTGQACSRRSNELETVKMYVHTHPRTHTYTDGKT